MGGNNRHHLRAPDSCHVRHRLRHFWYFYVSAPRFGFTRLAPATMELGVDPLLGDMAPKHSFGATGSGDVCAGSEGDEFGRPDDPMGDIPEEAEASAL